MRVPSDAAPGPATLRIEMVSDTGRISIPTEIPAEIRAPAPTPDD